jgi:hypothetical protein
MAHERDDFGTEYSQDDPIEGAAPAGETNPGDYHSGDQSAGSSEETGTIYGADGEPEETPHDHVLTEADLEETGVETTEAQTSEAEESNPNASGPHGLEGDLGISSERTGPDRPGNDRNTIQGTGTVGTATDRTEGIMETERRHPEMPAEGPEMDAGQNEAQESWRDKTDTDHSQVDRTVGEANTAGTTPHRSDPKRNPGHSHG